MQLSWLWRGLRTGVLATRYPRASETMPERWRGVVHIDPDRCRAGDGVPACVRVCLPGALSLGATSGDGAGELRLDAGACIACALCVSACPEGALELGSSFESAGRSREALMTVVSRVGLPSRPETGR